ncbi:MAG: replication-associated recombination protein A [Firmicutes bacterium]|nr:replication-associated recombination protein A [Bacillota bacterium]
MEDLLSLNAKKFAPLAERMRPACLDEFIGQEHIVSKDSLLSRAIKTDSLGSCIFYGPPGTGKTTLANIVANSVGGAFVKLNAVSSGVADAKKVIDEARYSFRLNGKKTYLLLDECHRWNKAQSDSVLAAIEEGCIVFIGSTTENPYTNMTRAIVSRCRVFEFRALSDENVKTALSRAVSNEQHGLGKLKIRLDSEAAAHYAWAASGDIRTALNALELAALTTPANKAGQIVINKQAAEQSIQKKAMSIDETMYYDMLSAFCKSLRGSDADAALYWANRLIAAGCDPLLIARRLVAHSSEDVGLADSNALLLSVAALQAIKEMGMPEGNIPLSQAIIYVCEAPKSNSVVRALGAAKADVEAVKDDKVPAYLKNRPDDEKKQAGGYKYPHDYGGYVKQQYLPDKLKDRIYYVPGGNGKETNIKRKKLEEK